MPDQQIPLPAPTIPTVMRAITPKLPMSAAMNALSEFKEICFPEYHPGKERHISTVALTLARRDVQGQGSDSGPIEFAGPNALRTDQLREAHSFFYSVVQHVVKRQSASSAFGKSLANVLSNKRDEVSTLNEQGGDYEMIRDEWGGQVRNLLEHMEKGKVPRQKGAAQLLDDGEVSNCLDNVRDLDMSTEDWQKWVALFERHRAWGGSRLSMGVEYVAANQIDLNFGASRHNAANLSSLRTIAYRVYVSLLAPLQVVSDDTCLPSFDAGVAQLVTSNYRRVNCTPGNQAEDSYGSRRPRKNDKSDSRQPGDGAGHKSQNLFDFYPDVCQRVFPAVYGVVREDLRDVNTAQMRNEWTKGPYDPEYLPFSNALALERHIREVSKKKQRFAKRVGGAIVEEEREVSCRMDTYFSVQDAINRLLQNAHGAQQELLNYARGAPYIDENGRVPPGGEGLDSSLVDVVNIARLFTEDGWMLIENEQDPLAPPRCHSARKTLMDTLGMDTEDDSLLTEWSASMFRLSAMQALDDLCEEEDKEKKTMIRQLHNQVAVFVERRPWLEVFEREGESDVCNPFYSRSIVTTPRHGPDGPIEGEQGVSFKKFARLLKEQTVVEERRLIRSLGDLAHGVSLSKDTNPELYQEQTTEISKLQAELKQLQTPMSLLLSLVDNKEFKKILDNGIVIDGTSMPQAIMGNYFFRVQVGISFPNRDNKCCDAEFKQPLFSWFEKHQRNKAKQRQTGKVFAGNTTLGGQLMASVPGSIKTEDGQEVFINENDIVITEGDQGELELSVTVDMTKDCPTVQWGHQAEETYTAWLRRFEEEGIDDFEKEFATMMGGLADELLNEQYMRDDMCERTKALTKGFTEHGVFGSCKGGTLQRVTVNTPYDATQDPSVNGKQVMLFYLTAGHLMAYAQRTALSCIKGVLSTFDPTAGEGASQKSNIHFNISGPPGTSKTFVADGVKASFPDGVVVSVGQQSAAVYKTADKGSSFMCGCNLHDEGRAELRVEKGRGANKDTGPNSTEAMKEMMSAGKTRSTIAGCHQLPNGRNLIINTTVIRFHKLMELMNDNNAEGETNRAIADRCFSVTLNNIDVEVSADEIASGQAPIGSATHTYQERLKSNGRLFCTIAAMMYNLFGAFASYAKIWPHMDTRALAFIRKAVTTVLERNGQTRFRARRINQITEMMKVDRLMGAVYDMFFKPWGLFSEQTIRKKGGSRGEFFVQDIFKCPQLYWVAKLSSCSFQNALAAIVMGLNQDRTDEVNSVREAIVLLIKRKSYWEMFGPQQEDEGNPFDPANPVPIDLDVMKVRLDGVMKNELHALNTLARKLLMLSGLQGRRGPLEGYSQERVVKTLQYIADGENEEVAVQRHPNNFDMLLVDKLATMRQPYSNAQAHSTGRGMPHGTACFTVKGLQSHTRLLYELNKSQQFPNELWRRPEYQLHKEMLNECMKMWKSHDYDVHGPGLRYYPSGYFGPDLPGDSDSLVSVKTIDFSNSVNQGNGNRAAVVSFSTYWVLQAMKSSGKGVDTELLQKQIIDETATSDKHSGYYATGGIGNTRMNPYAPQKQDIWYVAQNDNKVSKITNTNQIPVQQHDMYSSMDGTADLPDEMRVPTIQLKPQSPESFQMTLEPARQLIDKAPTAVIDAHWFMHADPRAPLIVGEHLLKCAEAVYGEFCTENKVFTVVEKDHNGNRRKVTVRFTPEMLQGDCSVGRHWMRRTHLQEVLLWMFDTAPEESPHGFRHLCRCYLTAAHRSALTGQPHTTGDDMFKDKDRCVDFYCYKRYLTVEMLNLYYCKGEGMLGHNVVIKASLDTLAKEKRELTKQFNELHKPDAQGRVEKYTTEQILCLPASKHGLDGRFTSEQSAIRIELREKEAEFTAAKEKLKQLRKLLDEEIGPEARQHRTYMESRAQRDDHVGKHSGEQYIELLQQTALEMHRLRIKRWGIQVRPQYEIFK